MGYKSDEQHRVETGNPTVKHAGGRRGTNPAFEVGAAASRRSNGAIVTIAVPVGRKPGKNKAAK